MDSIRLSTGSFILGISAYYNDSAACIVSDGRVLCAAKEEYFSRKKYDSGFPHQAISYCLASAGISLDDVSSIVFYEKPFLKFDRLLETFIALAPKGFRAFRVMLPIWLKEKLFHKKLLLDEFKKVCFSADIGNRILFTEHHHSLAANAFFTSPFEEAAILSIGGVGEWATTVTSVGCGNQIEFKKSINYPHSLGLVYEAFAAYLGFPTQEAGVVIPHLALHGDLCYVDTISHTLIDIRPDGSFRINNQYFGFSTDFSMTTDRFESLFGGKSRGFGEVITQRHRDIAASVQHVVENIVVSLVRDLARETKIRNLCLSGSLGGSPAIYSKIVEDGAFQQVWVPGSIADAGGAIGAALATYYQYEDNSRHFLSSMPKEHLGPIFSQQEIEQRLTIAGACYEVLAEQLFIQRVANAIACGKRIGWFQGGMEFGGHACGARAIFCCEPPLLDISSFVAVAVLLDVKDETTGSTYHQQQGMAFAKRELLEQYSYTGIIDYVLMVDSILYPKLHSLLSVFKALTGYSALFQYGLSICGEPIACTPEDAFRCLMATNMDLLVIGDCLLYRGTTA